jgi:type IV pilus assembly protein PilB
MAGLRISEEELKKLLVSELQVIDEEEFEKARRMAARVRLPVENALAERGLIPFGFLLQHVAQTWGVDFLDLKASDVEPDALRLLPEEYARRNVLAPFERADGRLKVAMWNPRDRRAVEEIRTATKLDVVPYLAPESAIRRAHLLYKGDLRAMLEQAASEEPQRLSRQAKSAGAERSAAELLTLVLEYAVVAGASDIHIEPYDLEAVVRYRIDGVLQDVLSFAPATLPSLVARVKVLTGMRIDERRAPQDGRFDADLGGFKIDLRVSTLPTFWGEKIVIRVLSKESVVRDLEDLGMGEADYRLFVRNLLRPFGMILATGPTGSGKSTTLYASIIRLGIEKQNIVNISTIEDPIEYNIPRVSQVQVNPPAGVEFATGLRALLRQDPDVIMVGEIRDRETAEIAVRTALVGRLLISTLHTNDATGAIPRLLDMGLEPYLVASTLALVTAQRLVRKICTSCRESVDPDPESLSPLRSRADFGRVIQVLRDQGVLSKGDEALFKMRLFRGRGCGQCNGTGFRGRIGVFELLEIDDETRGMIMARQDAASIRAAAMAKGMRTMLQDGLTKVFLGQTTLDEVFRVAL